MKTFFFFLNIYFLAFCVNAQKIAGIATYKYKFNNTKDTLVGTLYFDNEGESYYIVRNAFKMLQTNTTKSNGVISNTEVKTIQTKRQDSSVVYRNTNKKIQYYTNRILFRNVIVSDTLKDIAWILLSEKKKIGNFLCNSAKTRFAGRNYTVWYAPEIPVSVGPWKLHGLPGIIVEFIDDLDLIYYTLDNVEIKKEIGIKPFNFDEMANKSIRKDVFKKQQKLEEDKLKGLATSHGSEIKINNSQTLELEEN
jgi:GLPGLI family protein